MAKKRKKTGGAEAPKKRRSAKNVGGVGIKNILTVIIGGVLAVFAAPEIAKRLPNFSKYAGPLVAGAGLLLLQKGKGSVRLAGAGMAVGGSVLGVQAWRESAATSDLKKILNGPTRVYNGSATVVNGPARVVNGSR